MARNLLTLDQTLHEALRVDLEEKRHVDMVFTYYNEATAKTEYRSSCHRIAMAAKSRLLRHLLLLHGQDDENLHLVVVGNDHMTEAEDLIGLLYDPQKAGRDITLWEDEKVRIADETWPKVEAVLHADEIKEEVTFDDEMRMDGGENGTKHDSNIDEVDDEDYKPLKRKRWPGRPRKKPKYDENSDDDDFDLAEAMPKKRSLGEKRLREMEELQEAESKFDLSLDKMKELVAQNSDAIGYHEHRLKRIRVKFQALSYEGELVPYVCCVDCRKVFQYQPTKNLSNIYNHVKFCENDASSPDAKPAPNATILSHLIRTGSERVERYSAPEGELPAALSERFDCVKHDGKEVPWAVCKSCGMVLSTKFKTLDLGRNLELHKCNTQPGKSAGSASYSGDIDINQLEAMIKDKHPDVVTKVMSTLLGNFNRYLKYVIYKKSTVPFLYCRLCQRVLEEAGATAHECVTAIADITKIFTDEPARVTILEERLHVIYPYIFPLTLDGKATDFAYCRKCNIFLPKSVAVKRDYNHRCHRIVANKNIVESFQSVNLKPLPRVDKRAARSYECLICGDVLSSPYAAEVHMRRAHGEGGERVLCTFCGQGFSTMRLARQHEVQQHGAGGVPAEAKARYQCPECPQSFTLKGHLKRHLHLHTDALPFVCDLCGKAFKWKEVLKRHMLSHGEKTIPCDFCEQKFNHKKTYMNHRMTHTGERPHACGFCHQAFIQMTACKQHVFKVHGIEIPKGVGVKKFFDGLPKDPELAAEHVRKTAVKGKKPKPLPTSNHPPSHHLHPPPPPLPPHPSQPHANFGHHVII